MSAGTFAGIWANAAEVNGDAEVIPAGKYQVKLVGAGVTNDRVWTLWSVLTGELAGSSFFGGKYGLKGGDAEKTRKAEGFFKAFMIACGVTEQFFANATSLDDFAEAIKGVEGELTVKYRTFKDKTTGEDRAANDNGKFTLTARPPLPNPGGLPDVQTPQVSPQVAAQPTAPPLPPVQAPPIVPPPAPPAHLPTGEPQPTVEQQLAAAQAQIAALQAPVPETNVVHLPVAAPPVPGAITAVNEPTF